MASHDVSEWTNEVAQGLPNGAGILLHAAAIVRNAPRELDLDLLLFDGETRDTDHFTLPHPRAVDRLFVLAPAEEVLPDAVWPGTGRTIRTLRAELETDEAVERIEENAA